MTHGCTWNTKNKNKIKRSKKQKQETVLYLERLDLYSLFPNWLKCVTSKDIKCNFKLPTLKLSAHERIDLM